ncbi:phospholipase A1-Igamma1, chloroplastic [Eucalyptus grandis]|uniref:phospholipase A1-Igamma1, chloroplastic n=1 Tax=Eucalyptus grandis TaxID=71139 RepID=UPI00192E9435|nr:phospholipase A1-Igamma1, chloroplastic [Eucalyptus grandis]
MATSSMLYNPLPITRSNKKRSLSIARAQKEAVLYPPHTSSSTQAIRLAASLSNLLHLHVEAPPGTEDLRFSKGVTSHDIEEKYSAPTKSPKEVISSKWREMHGSSDWKDLLDPLHPWLRREIIKYGELAQATYDAFDFDSFSEYCGSCRYNKHKLFDELGLKQNGYKVTEYIYAMSHMEIPRWLERSRLADTWSKDSNWIGYIACSDDEETRRIGRRDILVAWRGTVAPSEWYEDFQRKLEPIGHGDDHHARVEHGFLSIYTSKSKSTRYNKSSASEQVMSEIRKLVDLYRDRGEEVSLTITGHSLGGALALLNAHEASSTIPNLPVSVISFGAPRVGNGAFRDELHQKGVKTLRVVVKQDMVPKMPGLVFNEGLERFDEHITGALEWVYTHVGAELKLDVQSSPYLKHGLNFLGFHMTETYLHLVDGFLSTRSNFRVDAKRDVALVNKACDMLVDELRVPHSWYQLANKGLVCNEYGKWVKPRRDPEDIPSPIEGAQKHSLNIEEAQKGRERLVHLQSL